MIYRNSFDRLFDSIFNESYPNDYRTTYSYKLLSGDDVKCDMNIEKDGAYLFFEVPGFNKSNLSVSVEGSKLKIEGRRKIKIDGKESEKVISKGFDFGEVVDSSMIEATVEDGILTLYVPNYNKKNHQKPKKIEIQ